jgi:hypothetical protein
VILLSFNSLAILECISTMYGKNQKVLAKNIKRLASK